MWGEKMGLSTGRIQIRSEEYVEDDVVCDSHICIQFVTHIYSSSICYWWYNISAWYSSWLTSLLQSLTPSMSPRESWYNISARYSSWLTSMHIVRDSHIQLMNMLLMFQYLLRALFRTHLNTVMRVWRRGGRGFAVYIL